MNISMSRLFALYISFCRRVATPNIHHLVSESQVLNLRTEPRIEGEKGNCLAVHFHVWSMKVITLQLENSTGLPSDTP